MKTITALFTTALLSLTVACGDNEVTTVREAGNEYGLVLCSKIDECVGRIPNMEACALDVESDVCDYATRRGYSCDIKHINPYLLNECLAWIAESSCDVQQFPQVCIDAFKPVN